MKASDRAIVLGLALAGLAAAFWFMVLSPKRAEVSTLDDEIAAVRSSVDEQEQLAAFAEQARDDYQLNYRRMVVLGKAVPDGEDTASLFVALEEIARRAEVDFDAIALESSGSAAPAPTPSAAAASETEADAEGESEDGETPAEEPEATPAANPPATEAAAALLPIGAGIGPAGLPVMHYELSLRGDFFELADFIHGLDKLVASKDGRAIVDGRLVTIDGFSLAGDDDDGFPKLAVTMSITTFVTPSDEGLTAGASLAGPSLTTAAPAGATSTPTSAP